MRRFFRQKLCLMGGALLLVVVVGAVGANWLAVQQPTQQPFRAEMLTGPSWSHLLGVDGAGRDVFSRILF